MSAVLHNENLLTSVAAKGICQGDGRQFAPTTTGTGVVAVQVDFVGFLSLHKQSSGECEASGARSSAGGINHR